MRFNTWYSWIIFLVRTEGSFKPLHKKWERRPHANGTIPPYPLPVYLLYPYYTNIVDKYTQICALYQSTKRKDDSVDPKRRRPCEKMSSQTFPLFLTHLWLVALSLPLSYIYPTNTCIRNCLYNFAR